MDLAAQGFGSVDQNARMLGRALEDPERGMTRLERMGVILNDTQKEQVTAMMEAGDAAGAQAILLGQAESASEGTAAATADASDKMAVAWESSRPVSSVKHSCLHSSGSLNSLSARPSGLGRTRLSLSASPQL